MAEDLALVMGDRADILRELDKTLDTLEAVDAMLQAEAKMNAAKHMSQNVRPHPLAAAVEARLEEAARFLDYHSETVRKRTEND